MIIPLFQRFARPSFPCLWAIEFFFPPPYFMLVSISLSQNRFCGRQLSIGAYVRPALCKRPDDRLRHVTMCGSGILCPYLCECSGADRAYKETSNRFECGDKTVEREREHKVNNICKSSLSVCVYDEAEQQSSQNARCIFGDRHSVHTIL